MKLTDYDLLLLSEPKYIEQNKYWLNKLSGEMTRTGLMPDLNRSKDRQSKEMDFLITDNLWARISKITKKMNMSVYLMMLTNLKILTFLYTKNEDIAIISPVYKPKRTKQTLNEFVVIRDSINEEMTFMELLLAIRETALEAYDNQDYPFTKILESLELSGEEDSLFGLACLLKNIHDEVELNQFQSGITLSFEVLENSLKASVFYNNAFTGEFTITQFCKHYVSILEQALENPQVKLSELTLLSDEERQEILVDFNNTKGEYPQNKAIHQLFEEQVAQTPENTAVVFENQQLTYQELNIRANHLAKALREKGVMQDSIIGIVTKRSLDMIVGILGILKAGGAYLPIDPKHPQERITFMLEDCESRLLLTDGSLKEVDGFAGEIIDLNKGAFYGNEAEEVENINSSTDLAYIMYTSGSTGRPKGVMVEHKNVIRLVKNTNYVELKPGDRILQTGALVFDACTFEIWGALLNGLELYLIDENVILDAEKLDETLKKYQITTLWLTSPLFNQLSVQKPEMFETVRNLLVGGDILSPKHINTVRNCSSNTKIINGYGPTENTTFSICNSIDIEYEDNIPIGRPISNSTAYIIDRHNKLCPIGVSGELCVSGDGVARGYLNNSELTAEKFVLNPFEIGMRMYKTGDLARWLPDGNVEFVGRIDQQVKIRGFRIDPGEIESQLLGLESVKEAVVLAKQSENHGKYLIAYVVVDGELVVGELRECLSKNLPSHMIPSYFVQLNSIPLTKNGKVDKKALPEPDGNIVSGEKFVAPRDYIEEKLAAVWEDVLGIDTVGINDNFFNLGGDSIKAIQIASRLNKYGLKMEIKDLFQYHSINELSGFIKNVQITADQGIVEGEVKLIPVQAWFFQQKFTNMYHFNHSIMLYSKEGFEENAIRKTFTKIVEHHDALRMVYKIEGSLIRQYNRELEGDLFDLKIFNFAGELDYEAKIEEEANKIQSGIDLEVGPLVKLGLFKTKDGDHLLVAIHHLVVDGISWRIIFEDLADAYKQALTGEEIKLPAKTHSFKEWSEKLNEFAQSNEMKRLLDYWEKLVQIDVKLLPKDWDIECRKVKDSNVLPMVLESEYTEKLLKHVNKAYNTEINDILLTTLGLAIKDWTRNDRVLINLEGHGREEIIKGIDITRTVGWFTTQYPMILNMSNSDDLSYLIKLVKENLRKVPDKGISYGILRYLTLDKNKAEDILTVNPEISFNYLGQFDQDVNKGVFNPSKVSTGAGISTEIESKYAFDINGMIANGQLVLKFSYNEHEYKPETVQYLVDRYHENLIRIIDHCTQLEETDITPSDLGDSTLSLEELDAIADLFDD
ncbi:MAG: amino acid adenylation domain-containing protein [Halanaerobiales bacterium]|nr:amino acid adenylation domain-containing protein [Halanaerobiales bacterium]